MLLSQKLFNQPRIKSLSVAKQHKTTKCTLHKNEILENKNSMKQREIKKEN